MLTLAARVVLFDWDGTLLDSAVADTRAYLAMFAALGIAWTEDDLARHYHPDWYRVYSKAKIHRSRWEEADRVWRKAYQRENPRLLPGARTVLRTLAERFTLGIVTSGSGARVRRQLADLRVADFFRVAICAEETKLHKPHPAPLRRALKTLGAASQETVYVGDSGQDMEMAERAGVRAIGIFGAFPTEQALRASRAAILLNAIDGLPEHLEPIPAFVGGATAKKRTATARAAALEASTKAEARRRRRVV